MQAQLLRKGPDIPPYIGAAVWISDLMNPLSSESCFLQHVLIKWVRCQETPLESSLSTVHLFNWGCIYSVSEHVL